MPTNLIASIVLLSALLCAPVRAQPAAVAAASPFVLDGAVARPGPLDPQALARLPVVSVPVSQLTGHGMSHERPSGVRLWDLLLQAGPQNAPAKHAILRHTLTVVGRDGYQVAFSFGELDPDGSADPVLVVVSAGHASLVVPGDRTAARNVHDVARMTVD